jgi:FlaA1/EpsC-like NDP-sugar epimerase
MSNNAFFKPTVLYKEFLILDLIEKDQNITQRQMAEALGVAVSMVNQYIDSYQDKGYLRRNYISTKTVEYFITKKGIERKKLLNIWYLKSTHAVYDSAKDNIITFLNHIMDKGYKKLLLYGAGEVAEIMLQTIQSDTSIPIEIIAVVDDDKNRQSKLIVNLPIISKESIKQFDHDGILISSYKHHEIIRKNLVEINYPLAQILEFFE